jgi:hypothetical protein
MNSFTPSSLQTDHFTSHSALLPVYEKLFDPIRYTTDSVLEIGTNDGGGIKMYSDCFPHAKCFGMDILPTPPGLPNDGKIFHYQRDAYTLDSVELMRKLGEKFALIVDDGPHDAGSQVWFVEHYPALLASDGLAIVEDVQEQLVLGMLWRHLPPGFNGMVIDLRHLGRYDDLLFVIWPKGGDV